MNNRNINAIISIASVVIMIIWGTLAGSYRHAWIAVFIGGVLITCLSLYNKGRADTDKADTNKADTNKADTGRTGAISDKSGADTDKSGADGGENGKEENDPPEK